MNRKAKLLDIHIYGDKVLREKAKPVESLTQEIKDFIDDLTYTMYERDGVGLAAPQVGISLRIFVCDPEWSKTEKKNPLVLINPKFMDMEGDTTYEEGCLSIPGIYEKVKRYSKVKISAYNENWEEKIYEADDLFSIVLQHENDHLDGILFTDKIPQLRKLIIKKQLKLIESSTDENGKNIKND
ncbi:MAG: peptide deformylase [Candidatus Cloacimonetes bacterium]|nr:peptide deformylase [Candidatus Cloacimonadota bacterium]